MTETKFNHHPKDLVLDYYHCTFFLPLMGLDQKGFQTKDENRFYYGPQHNPGLADKEAQAYRYFSPALRNILFDCNNSAQSKQAVKEWRLKEQTIDSWQLNLGKQENQQDPCKYQHSKIVSVRLMQYFNGIYLLAVRVEPQALIKLRQQNVFKDNSCNTIEELVEKDSNNRADYQQLAMENWLQFTRHVRLLYPSFPQQNDEHKIAPIHLIRKGQETVTAFKEKIDKIKIHAKPGQDFSPVIVELLKAFARQPEKVKGILENYEEFYDDRMFVSVAYGIAGDKLPDDSLQRINTLVSHVDRQQEADYGTNSMNGYVYTADVILEKTKNSALSLWEGLGGYYSYTDFSNSYLSTGWAFRTYIALEHIPYIYDRMLTQALFYQASLRYYDQQICEKTNEIKNPQGIKAISKQRGEFVRFTNQYWFHNVTTQMQGKEIFDLQQKALGLQQHYAILKDELERTDEYMQTEHQIKQNETADKWTRYGLILAFIAIYFTILPIIIDAAKNNGIQSIWSWVSAWIPCISMSQTASVITGMLIIGFFVPAIISWLLTHYMMIKQASKKD